MIIYKYLEGWDADLIQPRQNKTTPFCTATEEYHPCEHMDMVSWHDFISYSQDKEIENDQNKNIHTFGSNELINNRSKLAQHILQKIINSYDADDCIYGLFSALSQAKHAFTLSPFNATHTYCFKIYSCSNNGKIVFDVSPIYQLGPEYPEQYKKLHGTELDKNAIVGLIQVDADDFSNSLHRTFTIGIDAGVLFKDSKIPHHKKIILKLNTAENGIMASLSCESQTMSKKITWKELGFKLLPQQVNNGSFGTGSK